MSALGREAVVIGTGLIGGSVGLALKRAGWRVSGSDSAPETQDEALSIGAIDALAGPAEFDTADLVVVATPVGQVADLVMKALSQSSAAVTDVGSTKASICAAIDSERFVGGHPMAGSELDGIVGARPEMFDGAMWVLTPTASTEETAFATVRSAVRAMGAESISLDPAVHDELVAQVSHVPHLTAATLMCLADDTSVEHRALLRLAAGGFRDMTRISAGRPSIWPDICAANSAAISASLARLIEALSDTKTKVETGDGAGLLAILERAREARLNLPTGFAQAEALVELKVPIPDRPGEIAAITTLAAELDVNIFDLALSHSGEGERGVMALVVDAAMAERLFGGLMARGYRPRSRSLD